MPDNEILLPEKELAPLFQRSFLSIREDIRDNAYIKEALRVLPVGGHRSAIGSFWNAVVDDLRNKIIFRSLSLFNKAVKPQREVKTYEDFQNIINDDQLIDGAYAIGVIGWEASKVLKHAKETRHIFDGHPRSSDPSIVKVLSMMEDCIKYVLNAEYPHQIIDIDDYIKVLGDTNFDRSEIGVQNACGDLPEIFKVELVNRLYTSYIHPDSVSTLRSNIEFVAPILWTFLPKQTQIQVVRRVDQEISGGKAAVVERAFQFVRLCDARRYLSTSARMYKIDPLVKRLNENLDNWDVENECVLELSKYSDLVPEPLLEIYISALVHTYVGYVGASHQWSRTDFYANQAAAHIPKMFEVFDDKSADAFVAAVRKSEKLKERIRHAVKLRRLRSLGTIVLSKVSDNYAQKNVLEALVDENSEENFFKLIQ